MKTMTSTDAARATLREVIEAPVVTPTIARRALIAAAVLGVAMFGGCAAGTPAALQQAAQDALLIANALAAIVPALGVVVHGGALKTITDAIAAIQAVATALQSATTVAAAQPLVIQLETALNAIVGAVAGLNLPGTIGEVLTAASILLPVIELAVNLIVPPAPAPTPTPALARLRARAAATGVDLAAVSRLRLREATVAHR